MTRLQELIFAAIEEGNRQHGEAARNSRDAAALRRAVQLGKVLNGLDAAYEAADAIELKGRGDAAS